MSCLQPTLQFLLVLISTIHSYRMLIPKSKQRTLFWKFGKWNVSFAVGIHINNQVLDTRKEEQKWIHDITTVSHIFDWCTLLSYYQAGWYTLGRFLFSFLSRCPVEERPIVSTPIVEQSTYPYMLYPLLTSTGKPPRSLVRVKTYYVPIEQCQLYKNL